MSEKKEGNLRGKCQFIYSIRGGFPCSKTLFKGIIKRWISEMIVVNKKEDATPEVKPKRHILGFKDSKKVGSIQNEIFPSYNNDYDQL